MAKIEIDENEYAELRQVRDLAALMSNNPKARPLLQQAIAEVAPERVGPEVHIRNEVNERLSGIEKSISDFFDGQKKREEETSAKARERELEAQWNQGRAELREAGYNDEGVEQVEKLMQQRGIADHKAAMALFERENPPPEPVVTGGSKWNFFDPPSENDTGLKLLMNGDTDGFLAQAIPAALNDARRGR